ncbi:MAG: T9SS type A sorting domain-containing protein [Bacteroidota bacterium]
MRYSLLLAALLVAAPASAQLTLTRVVIGAGSVEASGGTITLRGTIGQLGGGAEAQPVSNEESEAPAVIAFALAPPMPNPARDRVTLRYGLDVPGPARVALVDMLGREVALAAEGDHSHGFHEATLSTRALASGVYVVRLEADGRFLTRTLTVVR